MRFTAPHDIPTVRRTLLALGLLAGMAGSASAQMVFDGNILFLNNAVNHGILTPIAAQQSAEMGKSIIYMLESNPGPGLGAGCADLRLAGTVPRCQLE